MAKLDIQIQIRKMLKPSTPTPSHLQSLSFSLFDQLAPPTYIPMLFHYLPSSEMNRAENAQKYAKLQISLAETLAQFYPLAGRFSEDDFSIHCNDEGVEYVETNVNANLTEFLHEEPKIIELFNDLLPWCVPPNRNLPSSPLLGVQVNTFNCGGLVIGIQISHIIADAFTIATFASEWAHVTKTGTTKGCLPSFGQLSSLFPARVLSAPPQISPPSDTNSKFVTRRFVFDALAIAKLRDKINSSAKPPSRVVLIKSLIWKVLVGISSAKYGHSRESSLFYAVNFRGKSKVQHLDHALGNFAIAGMVTLEANQSRKELNEFVNLVGNSIRDTSASIGKASIDDISSFVVSNVIEVGDRFSKGDEMDSYTFTSWCRFPWYETDFGWGKPFWINITTIGGEIIILIDTKDGNGIEAWVSLKEGDMAEFEKNPDILTFCSQLWMK